VKPRGVCAGEILCAFTGFFCSPQSWLHLCLKEYQITELGKEIVNAEILRLEEFIKNGKKITGGE